MEADTWNSGHVALSMPKGLKSYPPVWPQVRKHVCKMDSRLFGFFQSDSLLKRHRPGDTCLLMPWLTLPYHNPMAHSRPGPANLRSSLSLKGRIPPQADPWRGRLEERTSPWLQAGKWPKMARDGPPGLPFSYLESGPFSGHRGAIRPTFQIRNGPKWPKMARKSKKLHYLKTLRPANPLPLDEREDTPSFPRRETMA